jgi:hypothetical protein
MRKDTGTKNLNRTAAVSGITIEIRETKGGRLIDAFGLALCVPATDTNRDIGGNGGNHALKRLHADGESEIRHNYLFPVLYLLGC